MTALGIRDNNPLNLIYRPQDKWVGLIGQVQGKCSFDTPQHAFRAYTIQLRHYLSAGHDTIPKIIRLWSATDQAAYTVNVLRWGHFRADQVISLDDALVLFKSMCRQEDGSDPYPDSVIQEGIAMAENKTAVNPSVVVGASMGTADAITQLIVGALHDFAHFDVSATNEMALIVVVGAVLHHFFTKGDQKT